MSIQPSEGVGAVLQSLQQHMRGLTNPVSNNTGKPPARETPLLPSDSNQLAPRNWDRGINLNIPSEPSPAGPAGDTRSGQNALQPQSATTPLQRISAKLSHIWQELLRFMNSLKGGPAPERGAAMPTPPSRPVAPPVTPPPAPPVAPLTPDSSAATPVGSYKALVGTGFQSFKSVYSPNSPGLTPSNGEVTLRTMHGNLEGNRLKIFIPPGVKRFQISCATYKSPEEGLVTARFKQPPIGTAADVRPETSVSDTRATLSRLMNGEELHFYAPGSSGGVSIANSQRDDGFVGSEGGYIYLDLHSIPGNKILQLQTQVVVDEAAYRNWYEHATWDAAGNPRD